MQGWLEASELPMSLFESLGSGSRPEWCWQGEAMLRVPCGGVVAQLRSVGDAVGSFLGFSHW